MEQVPSVDFTENKRKRGRPQVADVTTIVQMALCGKTDEKIAREIGVSERTVIRYRMANNVRKPRGRPGTGRKKKEPLCRQTINLNTERITVGQEYVSAGRCAATNRKIKYEEIRNAMLEIIENGSTATHKEIAGQLSALCGRKISIWQFKYFLKQLRKDEKLPPGKVAEINLRTRRTQKNDAYIVEKVKELAEKLGRTPRVADAGSIATLAIKYFGSWNAALQASGLLVNRNTLSRNSEERDSVFRESLRKAAEALGHVPTAAEYSKLRKKLGLPQKTGIVKFYGSWGNALESAGFPSEKKIAREIVKKEMDGLLSTGRKFVFYDELPGDTKEIKKYAAKMVVKKGLVLLKIKTNRNKFLKVTEMGFPELPGSEKGRACTLRLVQGETLKEIAEAEGCSRERIRQLINGYLNAVVHGKKRKKIDLDEIAEKSLELFGCLPTVKQYHHLRFIYPDLPCVATLRKHFGGWPFRNAEKYETAE